MGFGSGLLIGGLGVQAFNRIGKKRSKKKIVIDDRMNTSLLCHSGETEDNFLKKPQACRQPETIQDKYFTMSVGCFCVCSFSFFVHFIPPNFRMVGQKVRTGVSVTLGKVHGLTFIGCAPGRTSLNQLVLMEVLS